MNALIRSAAALSLCAVALPAAAQSLPPAVADVERAFSEGAIDYTDGRESPPGAASGFDVGLVRMQVDADDGRLRIGLEAIEEGIFGDSDGDGDPDRGTASEDSPALGLGEAVQVDLDLDLDGMADFFVRIDRTVDLDGCGLFAAYEADGLPIGDCAIAPLSVDGSDLIIDIPGFGRLRDGWLPADALDRSFGARVIADSAFDDLPADAAPDRGFVPLCPYGGVKEVCDGVDEDCDGIIDEDPVGTCEAPELADGPALPTGCSAAPGGDTPTPLVLLTLLALVGLRRHI